MSDDNVVSSVHEIAARLSDGRLEGCQIQDVDLSAQGLPAARANDVRFRRVGLHGADVKAADLGRVVFSESSMRGVKFAESLFRGCSFFSCELIEGDFSNTTMSGTGFYSTHMGNVDFSGARVQSGTFTSCELFGARFVRATLINTRFDAQERGNVTLDRADFSNAVLVDCDLMGANLYGASFRNALLVKVDLRHANVTGADFTGAHLVDVQVDLGQLEAGERAAVEKARLDDPWRRHGFMREVLGEHSPEELMSLLEYVLRTYVIEGAEPRASVDSFASVLSQLKAQHEFPELDALRVRGTTVQVRAGQEWVDLGDAPAAREPQAASGSGPAPTAPAPPARGVASDVRPAAPTGATRKDEAAAPADTSRPPKNVGRSKRFRKLDID
ncbi:MAG: pentapeptide repeat-containing protein [Myxococcota bacterium]